MTITLDAAQVAGLIIGLAALLAAIAYLVRFTRRVNRVGRAVLRVLHAELENNGGSSLKDDVHAIAVAVGELRRDFDDHLTHTKGPRR